MNWCWFPNLIVNSSLVSKSRFALKAMASPEIIVYIRTVGIQPLFTFGVEGHLNPGHFNPKFQSRTFQPQTFQPWTIQPQTFLPWIFESWGWKVHGRKVWGWKIWGWNIISLKCIHCKRHEFLPFTKIILLRVQAPAKELLFPEIWS